MLTLVVHQTQLLQNGSAHFLNLRTDACPLHTIEEMFTFKNTFL